MKGLLAPARNIVLLLVLFGVAAVQAATDPLPRAQPEEVGLSSERLQQLTKVLKSYTDEGKVAGSVALVARRGRLVYFEAFGQRDREAKSAMHTDSLFRIASQTKAVVSVGAMMLVEQGKMLLTDPVSKYIPEFKETTVAVPKDGGGYEVVKAKRPITIHDLLTHTSGLSYGMGPAADLGGQVSGLEGVPDHVHAAVEVQNNTARFDSVEGDLGRWDAAQYGRGHGHVGGQRLRRGKLPEQSPLLADVAVEREG